MKPFGCIAWIAIRELMYERVFYVLLLFSFLSLGGSLLLGQLTFTEQSKITLDFMLAATQLSMALFAVFIGISLFKRELSSGSIAMVLSKPIARWNFLMGKYFGQVFVQLIVVAAMISLTIAFQMLLGGARFFEGLLQTGVLIAFEVTVLTAVTYFFATISGNVTTACATVVVFLIGHMHQSILLGLKGSKFSESVFYLLSVVLPNLEVFEMKALVGYGYTMDWSQVGMAGLYALLCMSFYLLAANLFFSNQDVYT